jgi:Ubiquitin family
MNQYAEYDEWLETSMRSLGDCAEFHEENEEPAEPERKMSGIIRPVFVDYGMRSIMVRLDMDDSFSEVKRVVEAKTGIPMDQQVLSLTHSGREIDGEKSLRELSYWGGAFCTLTKA